MLEGLKLALWRLGLHPDRCPYCGEDLVKEGHVREFYQRYTCPEKTCRFNNHFELEAGCVLGFALSQ